MQDNNYIKFIEAVVKNDILAVKKLLALVDPREYNSEALNIATWKGHEELAELLIPLSNPGDENNRALLGACTNGLVKIAKLLLDFVKTKDEIDRALIGAAMNGNVEIVKLLIPLRDDNEFDCANESLVMAVAGEYYEMVKILIPISKPKHSKSKPLRTAILKNHKNMVDLLFDVSDHNDITRYIKNDKINNKSSRYFSYKLNSLRVKNKLIDEVKSPSKTSKRKTI